MKTKKITSLGSKLTFMVILMALTLSAATILFGYQTYKRSMEDHFVTQGQNLARSVAAEINGDSLSRYLDTLQTDEAYNETLALMRTIKTNNDITYLYVVKPTQTGTYYVYDTDDSEDRCELGYFEEWYSDFSEASAQFISGQAIAPVISNESFGWLLSVYEPIHASDGSVAGYVGADFSMQRVVQDRQQFLFTLLLLTGGITVAFVVVYTFIIRKSIVLPINRMARAADDFLVKDNLNSDAVTASSFASLRVHTHDELSSLAEALTSMEQKITLHVQNLDAANKRAETDSLTGLYNRGALQRRVDPFLRLYAEDGGLHCFIMIDLDHFKHINDSFGHITGDEMLLRTAQALRRVFRSGDLIARMGGDEFAVFCKSAGSIEVILQKAGQVCEAIRGVTIPGSEEHLSASVGVSLVPQNGNSYEILYQTADAALYRAKDLGRDQFVL